MCGQNSRNQAPYREQPVQQLLNSDNLANTDAAIQVVRTQKTCQQRPCRNCSSTHHATRTQDCPAKGQTCRRCQKPKHFAKCCRSSPADYPGQSHDSQAVIHTVVPHPLIFSRCPVYLEDCCVPLNLDTGAKVSAKFQNLQPALPTSAAAASAAMAGVKLTLSVYSTSLCAMLP